MEHQRNTFGYSEEEIPNLNLSEWDAVQEVIKTSPETIKAVEQIEQIYKSLKDYEDGLILAVDTIDNIKEILKGIK